MGKAGRPFGTYQYNESEILEAVEVTPKTTNHITAKLKEKHPTIHGATVLKYLKKLEKLGYVKKAYESPEGKNKVVAWFKTDPILEQGGNGEIRHD